MQGPPGADCCECAPPPVRGGLWLTAPGVLAAALVPKCPVCLAAYGSVFAAADVSGFVVGPLVTTLVILSVALLTWYAVRRRNFVLGASGVAGLLAIYGLGRQLDLPWGLWLGAGLLAGGYLHEVLRRLRASRAPAQAIAEGS